VFSPQRLDFLRHDDTQSGRLFILMLRQQIRRPALDKIFRYAFRTDTLMIWKCSFLGDSLVETVKVGPADGAQSVAHLHRGL
jgi:hypothetical protein